MLVLKVDGSPQGQWTQISTLYVESPQEHRSWWEKKSQWICLTD